MKRRRLGAIVFVMSLAAWMAPAEAGETPVVAEQVRNPQVAGRIAGSRSGAKRADAVVRLVRTDLPGDWTTRTDASGRFAFEDLPPGTYWVLADHGPGQLVTLKLNQMDVRYLQLRPEASADMTPTFEAIGARVAQGRKVTVTLASGAALTGRVAELTPTSITLVVKGERRDVAAADVWQLQKRKRLGTRWLEGAGMGFSIAAAFPILTRGESRWPYHDGRTWLKGVAIGAGLGALVGSFDAVPGDTVFQRHDRADGARIQLSPVVTPAVKGLALSVGWK